MESRLIVEHKPLIYINIFCESMVSFGITRYGRPRCVYDFENHESSRSYEVYNANISLKKKCRLTLIPYNLEFCS